jgi:hypothetical protein
MRADEKVDREAQNENGHPKGAAIRIKGLKISHQAGAQVDTPRHKAEGNDQADKAEQNDGLELIICGTGFDANRHRGNRNDAHNQSPLLVLNLDQVRGPSSGESLIRDCEASLTKS